MSERDFLMSLKAGLVPCPGDIDTVLILADWLDEDGQYQKAAWIRQQVKAGGIPHFDEQIQPDLFFRCGIKWKVFRNGRPGSVNVEIHHLVDLYQDALPWEQRRILRGFVVALYDQGQPEAAMWFSVWVGDATEIGIDRYYGTIAISLNGPDYVGWDHQGPFYCQAYMEDFHGTEFLEYRRYPTD